MMLQWKYRDNAKCPRCDEIEDTHHVVQYQHVGNINSFLKATEPRKDVATNQIISYDTHEGIPA